MSRPETEELPAVGTALVDSARGRVGEFRGASVGRGRYALRPIGGGLEWDVSVEHTRPATQEEIMSARVDIENARSRESLGMQGGTL